MNKLTLLASLLASATLMTAQASVIQVETASGSTPILFSATDYQAAVDAALLGATHASATPASLDFVSHQGLFGGNANFAMKTTVNFGVATAGNWSFRAGVDFGMGGAMFLDGVAVDLKSNDMWWEGNYNNPSQFFAATSALAAGNHVLTVMGFEGCCDGGQQVQFMAGGANAFTSFAVNDGLAPVRDVPEPASLGLAAAGLGMLGLTRRRKAGARTA